MMIADSDVLIDFLRGRDPGMSRIKLEISTGRLATTAINAFELLTGAQTKAEFSKVSRLLAALTVLEVDRPCATLAAKVRRQLEKDGKAIGMADCLIAGVCLAQQAILITRNLEHFGRVPNLKISGQET